MTMCKAKTNDKKPNVICIICKSKGLCRAL